MTQRQQWFAVGGLLVAMAGVLGVAVALSSGQGLLTVGSEAPDFRLPEVATGDSVALSDYRGDVVLLNVWATWCRPCEQEMPSMQRLWESLGPHGLKVVAVSIDETSPEKVLDWVRARNLTFDVLQDRTGRIQRAYQTTGVPESFVLDRSGVIVKRQIGAIEWDHPAQVWMFQRLLGVEDRAQ